MIFKDAIRSGGAVGYNVPLACGRFGVKIQAATELT